MPNTCPVCVHSQRHVIDEELSRDSAVSVVADSFGVSHSALVAHFAGCLLGVVAETDRDADRKARADAERDAAYDGAGLDALIDAIVAPGPCKADGGASWQP